MEKSIKSSIRLNAIHKRSLKPSYKLLTPLQKRLVKAMEAETQAQHEMAKFERVDKNWRQTEPGEYLLERYLKATKAKAKVAKLLGIESEEEENRLYRMAHKNHASGGSY